MERIAIITGATGGIGQIFIEKIAMLEDIDRIWAIGRNSEKLQALSEKYDKVIPIETDLAGDGMITAEHVVSKALKDSSRGKDMSVPGFFANYFRFYSKITPTSLIMKLWVYGIRKYI